MGMLLSDLAAKLGLTLVGQDEEFTGLNTLDAATDTEVTFLANPKYAHLLSHTKACAVIVDKEHAKAVTTALISDNPYIHFAMAASFFVRRQGEFTGISDQAHIHPGATLGSSCTVLPHAYIGPRARLGAQSLIFPGVYIGEDCVLGDNCVVYPNAVILAGVRIGDDCVINAGAVLGTDGFGFVRSGGVMHKIPQIGNVRLADGVDIGANSCVDRSTLGETSIGRDSKIDNLVQIGHNVTLGEQNLIISQVGIAGSTKVGDRVTMAGQAGIAGHLTIGDDVTIGPQAGVPKDIASGASGSGSPFMEGRAFLRNSVLIPKLPDIYKRLQQLEKELAALKHALERGECKDKGEES